MFDLSNRNRALSPSIWADSRDVSWPDIIKVSLSQTCHSHRPGFRAVSFTSSSRDRGAFAIPGICARNRSFATPELCHNQTDQLSRTLRGRSWPACGITLGRVSSGRMREAPHAGASIRHRLGGGGPTSVSLVSSAAASSIYCLANFLSSFCVSASLRFLACHSHLAA